MSFVFSYENKKVGFVFIKNLFLKLTSVNLVLIFLLNPISTFAHNLENDYTKNYNIKFDTYDLTDEHVKLLKLYNKFPNEIESFNERAKVTITVDTIKAALTRMRASSSF